MSNSTEVTTNSQPVFNFGDNQVRLVVRDGEPWFVATDVCKALGYRDAEKGTRNLSPHQKADTQIMGSSSGGAEQLRKVAIINESGLYRLVLRSRKPEAEKFSDWVTGEVLPSIRKTGQYQKPEQMHLDYDRISPAQAQDLKEIVAAIVEAGVQGFGETWKRFQHKFKVNSYLELPATRHLEAREYLIAKLPNGGNETIVEEAPAPKISLDDAVRLDLAFTLASQTAAKVQRAVFNGVMTGDADWKRGRYLVKLDTDGRDGEVTVNAKQIERNACVAPIDRFYSVIEDSVAVDAQTLTQLASTCMARLGRMAQRAMPAATKAIGVAA